MPKLFGPNQKQLFPIIPTKPCPKRGPFQKWNWISKTCFGNSEVLDINLFSNPIRYFKTSFLIWSSYKIHYVLGFNFDVIVQKICNYSHLRGVGSTINLGGHTWNSGLMHFLHIHKIIQFNSSVFLIVHTPLV